MLTQWDGRHVVSTASRPALAKNARTGTHSRVIGEETKTEGRATRRYTFTLKWPTRQRLKPFPEGAASGIAKAMP